MNSKKGLRYYGIVFGFSVIALAAYILYLSVKEGSFDSTLLFSLVYVPFMFTLFLFVFDKIFDKFFPSKAAKVDSHLQMYHKRIAQALDDNCEFSIEDYRRLRENASFQKALEQTYRVLTDGETDEINFQFLEKKFKKDTNEFTALFIVIKEVKEMMENS